MSKYEFKAINLIAETFEKHEAKFRVFNMQGQEELVAGFSVDGGPNVMMNEETVSAGREDGTGGNGAARGIDTDSVDGQESFAAFLRMVSADIGAETTDVEDIA